MDETLPEKIARMEIEERRIWVKVRFWSQLSLEQAAFLQRLDALRGFVRVPDEVIVSHQCWRCGLLMPVNEADRSSTPG